MKKGMTGLELSYLLTGEVIKDRYRSIDAAGKISCGAMVPLCAS